MTIMPKFSSSLESEIAGLENNDPTLSINPLRREQIKQELLRQIQTIPQNGPTILQKIKTFLHIPDNSFTSFGFITLALIILGGFTTIGIAHAAEPGDLLYTLKLKTEKIQLALAVSDESKAELQAEFIEAHLNKRYQGETNLTAAPDDSTTNSNSISDEPENLNLTSSIKRLEALEIKMQQKGNTNAAASIHKNIEKFKTRIAELENKTKPIVNGEDDTIEEIEKIQEKNVEQKTEPNVIKDMEVESSDETEMGTSTEKIIKVEKDTKSIKSTEKVN